MHFNCIPRNSSNCMCGPKNTLGKYLITSCSIFVEEEAEVSLRITFLSINIGFIKDV